ncbi:NAD(P)-binding protein [Xylariaceae sp. AK1471]|nr:NAD(P)-binding protein [Xylariaceae sp. AK1471]
MPKLAIVGASGKLGGATLRALLTHKLAPPSDVIALTSSTPDSQTWAQLSNVGEGVQVRHARFEDPASFETALKGVDRFFLVSTPNIALDFGVAMDYDGTADSTNEPESGNEKRGRESHHKNAIDAAVRAGVKYIVYSSLAFGFSSTRNAAGDESKAGVMRAHLRTEAYLRSVGAKHGVDVTILREGLYNESWPLYLGYFDVEHADAERDVVPLAGDGKVCWTAIHDLGVASALVLSGSGLGDEEFVGKTFYLSARPETAKTMAEIAQLVGKARGRDVQVKTVGRDEHVRYYVEEQGKPKPAVEWWVSTYEALEDGECLVDDPIFEKLLDRVGLKPIPVEETVAAMVKGLGS